MRPLRGFGRLQVTTQRVYECPLRQRLLKRIRATPLLVVESAAHSDGAKWVLKRAREALKCRRQVGRIKLKCEHISAQNTTSLSRPRNGQRSMVQKLKEMHFFEDRAIFLTVLQVEKNPNLLF